MKMPMRLLIPLAATLCTALLGLFIVALSTVRAIFIVHPSKDYLANLLLQAGVVTIAISVACLTWLIVSLIIDAIRDSKDDS